METPIKLCFSLLFLIIRVFNLSRIVEAGDNSLINDDLRGTLYKTGDDLESKNLKNSDECYNACTYNNGKDPNIRKNIEEIIKVLVKDSLTAAMETPDEQEHDIARDIQVAANEIIIEIALHASKITQKILQSMKRTNDTQVAIDTETQHSSLIGYQSQIKKIEELEAKISLLSNNTEKLTDKINVNNKQQSEAIAIINNKLTGLDNVTSSDIHEIRDVLAVIEKHLKSVMNFSEPQISQKVEENVTKVTSLCDVKVPISIVPKHDIWKKKQIPEKDDLDIYMINKTGCTYAATLRYQRPYLKAVSFPGQLEWRVAVRARDDAEIRLLWDSENKYSFYIGEDNNTVSRLYGWELGEEPERATPGLLAEDRYVPFYFKISNGKLTAGAECEPEPWFTTDFTAENGNQSQILMRSYSRYGAKYLYDCPARFTG